MKNNAIALLLNEAVNKNTGEFVRTQNVQSPSLENLMMYKMIQTLSNFHDATADMYDAQGNTQKAKYHRDISVKLRTDASGLRSKL